MLTNLLTKWGITRDSALWFWGKLAGAIIMISTVGGEDAFMKYGIPLKYMHIIQIAAAWILYFAAQQSTSKLNGGK